MFTTDSSLGSRHLDLDSAATRPEVELEVIEVGYSRPDTGSEVLREAHGLRGTNLDARGADLNRFGYDRQLAHFPLLQDGLRGLKEHLLDASTKRADSNVHPVLLFSLPMLEHLLDARELFRALATKGTGSAVHRELHSMLTELIVERLDTSGGVPTAPASLVAEFVVGAFLAICFWWLSGRDELSPQEVDRMFQALAMPGLRTNAGWASSGVPSGP